ncbi:MAG: STAS domain-containing protein [Ignavibacteria bacterium]|jgi:anti-anti-sigma factor|nr:STAS domain-containing protein [Ignavibacteria bacterium]
MTTINYKETNGDKIAEISVNKVSLSGIDSVEFIEIINQIDDDTKSVITDLSGVTFISSPGLGMLLNANIILTKRKIQFMLSNVSAEILHLFEITRLNSIIKIINYEMR